MGIIAEGIMILTVKTAMKLYLHTKALILGTVLTVILQVIIVNSRGVLTNTPT